jgi:uncharacterized protein YutE (UPF0331/DUF86 family)
LVDPDKASIRLKRLRESIELLYLSVDDERVFDSLSNLDDLRQFAAFVADHLD